MRRLRFDAFLVSRRPLRKEYATRHVALPVHRPSAKAPAPPARAPLKPTPSLAQRAAIGHVLQRRTGPATAKPAPKAPGGGLPARLQAGIETLSGFFMGDVRVHRGSAEPAKLGALAYTQGNDIHLGPGQERHLPHEAWHVVQQKQGRGAATMQMKGVAINEDAGLEAEADRMGEASDRGLHIPPSNLRDKSIGSAPIQRKVKCKEIPLTVLDPVSDLLSRYIKSEYSYVLRDNFENDLKKTPIHLIDAGKKYLLGEQHGSGKWEAQTLLWTTVDKMTEVGATIPHEADDTGKLFHEPVDTKDQPLESVHAYMMLKAIRANDYLNSLSADWVRSLWTKYKPTLVITIDDVVGNLEQLEVNFDNDYSEYIKTYEKHRPQQSKRLKEIYDIAVALRDIYVPAAKKLLEVLGVLRKVVAAPDPADPLVAAAAAKRFLHNLDRIGELRLFLPTLAHRMIEIVGIPDSDEKRGLSDLASEQKDFKGKKKVYDITNPARERAMVDQICQASAPLLVQIGNAHVQRVAKGVGADAVAVDMNVKGRDTLDAFTEVT